MNVVVDAMVACGTLNKANLSHQTDFYTVVCYLVYGGDSRLMGSIDQFWSNLRSYRMSYNEFILVIAGFFASKEGEPFDTGIINFMKQLADDFMDGVLKDIVLIDDEFREFLGPTMQKSEHVSTSAAMKDDLWDEEWVHVYSLWCFARAAGLLLSEEALRFMFDSSMTATLAAERMEYIFPGVLKEDKWAQSILSSLSLLVIHASKLDDILFGLINFAACSDNCTASAPNQYRRLLLKNTSDAEAPLRAALLIPTTLLGEISSPPSILRYAYFPYCVSQLLSNFEKLEEIYSRCLCRTSTQCFPILTRARTVYISLRSFLEVLEESHVTPDWIEPEKCLRLCNDICENFMKRTCGSCSTDNCSVLDFRLSVIDLYELIFGISQVCRMDAVSQVGIISSGGTHLGIALPHRSEDFIHPSYNHIIADQSIEAWKSAKGLILKILQHENVKENLSDIATLAEELDLFSGDNEVRRQPELFDGNVAAVICSVLYAPSQPYWRGQWLLQTSETEIPVSSFPLDSRMKCTMDVVLFTTLLNYPYCAPDYSLWRLNEIFNECEWSSKSNRNTESLSSPINELCARRMYSFLRHICVLYRISTADIMSYLKLSLLADEFFAQQDDFEAREDSSVKRAQALKALSSIAMQARTVLLLSSKSIWQLLSSAEAPVIWEYTVACSSSYITNGEIGFSSTCVCPSIVVAPVPNNSCLQSGYVVLTQSFALVWGLELVLGLCGGCDDQTGREHVLTFLESLRPLQGVFSIGHSPILNIAMFSVFASHLICAYGKDLRKSVKEWTQQLRDRASIKYWESNAPTSALLLPSSNVEIPMESEDLTAIIVKAISSFDQMQSHTLRSALCGPVSVLTVIPPRPPGKLWDAPRCVQFCRQMGVIHLIHTILARAHCPDVSGISLVWNAVSLALSTHYNGAKLSPWTSRGVVAPLPFNVSPENVTTLLHAIARALVKILPEYLPASSGQIIDVVVARLILWSICPVIVSYEMRCAKKSQLCHGISAGAVDFSSSRSLEDLLRYGGSKVAQTLKDYHAWLVEEFRSLSSSTKSTDDVAVKKITAMTASKYFSCGGLLKMKTAIMVTGVALHPYWRHGTIPRIDGDSFGSEIRHDLAITAADNARAAIDATSPVLASDSEIYICYQEFEELFLRCAFALYEQAGCLFSSVHPKPSFSGFDQCKTSESKCYVHHYCSECEKIAPLQSGKLAVSQFTAGSWGVDFLFPFASTLQLVGTRREKNNFFNISKNDITPIKEMRQREFYSLGNMKAVLHDRLAIAGPLQHQDSKCLDICMVEDAERPEEIVKEPFRHSPKAFSSFNALSGDLVLPIPSIVDDAIIRGRDKFVETILAARQNGLPKKISDITGKVESPASVQLKLSVPTTMTFVRRSPRTLPPLGGTQSGCQSPARAISPLIPHGSPLAARSPKRSSPITERSIGIDALLDGTKEVLWPVFATYCSCGDSMEPGKLSGPNLFALLSKLNVLTNETALSDIGVLLHQVSSHTTAQAPTAALVESDDANGLDSPLLSFEEFLVFLCAFSHLRYEGTGVLPDFSGSSVTDRNGSVSPAVVSPLSPGRDFVNQSTDSVSSVLEMHSPSGETWLECWYHGKKH